MNTALAVFVGVFVAYHVYLYLAARRRPTDSEWVSRLDNYK